MDPALFIRHNPAIVAPPLVPEVRLYLATEVTPIWQATEESLAQGAVPPPYWAFAWAGGQALARYLLDHPAVVADRQVVDFATGSGIVAIAAMKSGAAHGLAADNDPVCASAVGLNADANRVVVNLTNAHLLHA